MRLVWTTDIHLNHADFQAWDDWAGQIDRARPDAILITGDLSEGDDVSFQLRRLGETFDADVFFVLGNHDFYGTSIAEGRRHAVAAVREIPSLHYLTDQSPIELTPGRFLIGDDGWGDATEGDYENSIVRLNDFTAIRDFRESESAAWPRLLRDQGHQSAQRIARKLNSVVGDAHEIVVATHVPPFRESCWYEGKTTDDHWAPFFVCGAVGSTLKQFAFENPNIRTTVLCGHTHHGGTAQMAENLVVLTASAEYGRPSVERVFDW
ncbi:MAG: metallophosphoesterase [Planctomycetota bacterium]